MNNYYSLIKEILCDKFRIYSNDFKEIKNIIFNEFGIIVTFSYYHGDDLLSGCERIFNSEINAYIFEQSFNK